jgi:hypothetical protein
VVFMGNSGQPLAPPKSIRKLTRVIADLVWLALGQCLEAREFVVGQAGITVAEWQLALPLGSVSL